VFFSCGLVVFGAIAIIMLIIAAVFAPWVAPYNPYETNLKDKFINLGIEHPLGTDYLGRDVLSRIIYGSRTSLIVGVVAIGSAAIIGVTMGLASAFFGGNLSQLS